jgi:tRNA threonylcarbamoyladenosine biosynthesis protein TsaB
VLKLRPVFTYQSLEVVAHSLARNDVTVIADARRDTWHALTIGSKLRRVATADLSGALVMPEGFRHWTPVPSGTSQTPYLLREHMVSVVDRDIFRPTDAPDAFLHEEPAYAKWLPQIHRAP